MEVKWKHQTEKPILERLWTKLEKLDLILKQERQKDMGLYLKYLQSQMKFLLVIGRLKQV